MLVFDVGDIMSFHFIEEIKDDVMKLREVQRLHPFIVRSNLKPETTCKWLATDLALDAHWQ